MLALQSEQSGAKGGGGGFYSFPSSKLAPFMSAAMSATAPLTSSISFLIEPPSSTPAVALVSP